MRRMALLVACLAIATCIAVVACTTTIAGTPRPAAGLAPTVTATTTTAALVAPTSINDKLLSLSELGQIVDDTEMKQQQSYPEPDSGKKPVNPFACGYRLTVATAVGYFDSKRLAMAGNSNRGTAGHVAAQVIAVFEDRSTPAGMLTSAKLNWNGCPADQPFTVTTTDGVSHWVPDQTAVEETRIATTITRQEPPPRTCHHVMARQANVVVETFACDDGNTTDQANQIADRILAKLPS